MNESRAKYSSQEAAEKIGSIYNLVLAASCRYRELKRGYVPMIQSKSGPVGIALEEIEAGIIGKDYIVKNVENNLKTKLEYQRRMAKFER
jgi:DNA-directed RNA polymerase omega subunit